MLNLIEDESVIQITHKTMYKNIQGIKKKIYIDYQKDL